MAQLIVRKLDEAVKRKLERRAVDNGHSLAEEVRRAHSGITRLPYQGA